MTLEPYQNQMCRADTHSTWGRRGVPLACRLRSLIVSTAIFGALCGFATPTLANLPPIDVTDPNVTSVTTGGINPLITRVWDLPLNAFPRAPFLNFSFAFSTEETPRDGLIVDSATFYIQDLSKKKVSFLATVDGNGVTWLPRLEGAVPIFAEDLTHEALPFPSLQPVMAINTSHSVTLQIPAAYFPEPAQLVFQMFDYPNGYNSVGVVTPPTLFLVPEPAPIALGCLGLAILSISRTRFRTTSRATIIEI